MCKIYQIIKSSKFIKSVCINPIFKIFLLTNRSSPKRRLSELLSPSELLDDPLEFDDIDQALNEAGKEKKNVKFGVGIYVCNYSFSFRKCNGPKAGRCKLGRVTKGFGTCC